MTNKKIVIFGGLGFIGRNLAINLLKKNYNVTLVEHELKGKNLKVAKKIKNLKIIKGNILDKRSIASILKHKYNILFNLAAHSGPKASVDYPFLDLETNTLGSLNILEEAKKYKDLVVVFLGSRLEYGEVNEIPVSEKTVSQPQTMYGLSKFTASSFHLLYNKLYSVKTIIVKGANPYGTHIYNPNPAYNIINYFIDKANHDEDIEIFETAKNQIKDYIYIDDFCEALVKLSLNKNVYGQVYNLGSGKGIKFIDAAKTITRILKKGRVVVIKQNSLLKKIEAGDYVSDISKISKRINWKPKISFVKGILMTTNIRHIIFDI
ncbi:MAG: NAD-dependent epimerase/dehydratase [Candidatus Woesebacteria bacterium GW2011_GWA1_33_30]|uniref:NAD-dependent epimerase/dehydratase n=1 Tax=Candidatus Woesebacteria bacterium GW2011_GWA2_33_28 TaxID=1618561 RepID=A0A0F9ZVS7_9BACT|nr:MAG: NAD-dependent epimerase/dehydratase [Candidatus Woesebacteria bacterium GW2011_GWA2_33_28]KKP49096.1 MAG: NAD-dependent epimerase/dehydratase [Candidatus Woesebacteria bacterium GW2011_GWA1_33_30]KKP50304.1 MAG: NAD-dependent epimerase/dehydratase [Microgenomates group bacterium GW2011_GWC1_33_32]KKP52687.1 MAG: NAD-dependent epimerase/dehydratase [Candidatus Woesebacteria bacterium GW2011_GWB1_33_38]KKP58730.1 MAG: NAD-dependent epimerase/dehydratase [Microgenomates group bacterium GW2